MALFDQLNNTFISENLYEIKVEAIIFSEIAVSNRNLNENRSPTFRSVTRPRPLI